MPSFTVTSRYSAVPANNHLEARENCLQGVLESTEARLDFDDIEATHGNVVVLFHDLGEGMNGDEFDQDDEDDEPRLRFDANEVGRSNGEGPIGHDESRLTDINPLRVDPAKLKAFALHMAKQFQARGEEGWKSLADTFGATTTDQVHAFKDEP